MSTATESKHTPGPWKVTNLHDLCSPEVVGNGRNVAMVRQPFASDEETAANARLIAAAPAMLEALELLMACVPDDWKEMAPISKAIGVYLTGKQLESFEAAIRLSKGESR